MTANDPVDTTAATSYHLRFEAGPQDYKKLFAAEKAAIDAVIQLLREAVRIVHPIGDRHGQPGKAGYVIEGPRASRIAFLSGRRGSGKTRFL